MVHASLKLPQRFNIVNSDCTGTLIGAPGGNADGMFVIVSGGAEVFGTQTDPGGTWNADLKKQ